MNLNPTRKFGILIIILLIVSLLIEHETWDYFRLFGMVLAFIVGIFCIASGHKDDICPAHGKHDWSPAGDPEGRWEYCPYCYLHRLDGGKKYLSWEKYTNG